MKSDVGTFVENKKFGLLRVSEELFAMHGFDGTSTRMIAEKSGVNIAMINYYFGSKEALYIAIFENRLSHIIKEIERIDHLILSPAAKLETYLRGYIARIHSNQGFYRMETRQLTMLEQPKIVVLLNESRNKAFLLIRNIILNGIAEGIFRQVDVEVFTLNILYLLPSVFTRPPELFSPLGFAIDDDASDDSLGNRVVSFLLSTLII